MKKYILATLILFIPCVTYALTMCARDDSLVVALKASIGGISGTNTYSAAEFVWRADYNYGTILGEATCLSAAEGGQPYGNIDYATGAIRNQNNELIPQSVPKGRSGQSDPNPDNPDLSTERRYCWCRMTHPASSRWVYLFSLNAAGCSGNCANYCSSNALGNVDWRKAMFNSIGK